MANVYDVKLAADGSKLTIKYREQIFVPDVGHVTQREYKEVYKINAGKIVLDKTVEGVITPPQVVPETVTYSE